MYFNSTIRLVLLFLITIFTSCQNNKTQNEISAINQLESLTQSDLHNLNTINIDKLQESILISDFNLLELEKMEMIDSSHIELINFEYRNYLDCIRTIREIIMSIQEYHDMLTYNAKQLSDLKLDYQNSKNKTNNLDLYLNNETTIIKNTSIEIEKLSRSSFNILEYFEHLNFKIENIINEN